MKNFENTVHINGADIWCKVSGEGPVLMVQAPGWGIGSKLYEDTLSDLSRNYTLVFHDPRGSGRSKTPDQDYSKVNVGQFNDDLEGLREHLEITRFTLLGHSHGGYIAANHALKFPQYLSGLILVDAQLGVSEPGEDLSRTLPKLAGDARFAAAVEAFTGSRTLETDSDMGTFLKKIGALYFKDPVGRGFDMLVDFVENNPISLSAFMATSATDKNFPIRQKLQAIAAPTLVLVGEHDFICSPVQAQAYSDGIFGAHLVTFEQSGHFCWVEEPERFRRVLADFMITA